MYRVLIDQTERSDEMVTERQQDILNLIIDIFTKTHEPVGSKALQESINSSSAPILQVVGCQVLLVFSTM